MPPLLRTAAAAAVSFALLGAARAQASPFLYVADAMGATLSQFDVAAGALAPLTPATIATGIQPSAVAVTPDGRHAYVTDGEGTLSEYALGAGGAATPIGTVRVGASPIGIAVAPDGKHVYAADSDDGTVSQLSVGADGTLTSLGTVAAGRQPAGIAVTPDGAHAYATNDNGRSISEYAVGADGRLTSTGTLATSSQPFSIAVAPDGEHAYVALIGGDAVAEYAIGAGGALTQIGSIATGTQPAWIAIAPDGGHAYVTNHSDSTVSQYAIDAGGTLTSLGSVATGLLPVGIALTPDGRRAFIANGYAGTVSSYTVGDDGVLTPGSVAPAGSSPFGLAVGAGVDLGLSVAATPDPAKVGADLTYTLRVTDRGIATTGVEVSDVLPADVRLVSASAGQGSCSGGATIVCELGALDAGGSATIAITVTPTRAGQLSDSASVRSDKADATPADNAAAALTAVHSAPQATTTPAGALAPSAAQLNGVVDPQGEASTYRFQYVDAAHYAPAASDPYAAGATLGGSAGDGLTGALVSAQAAGLAPATTYHVRLVAANATGTTTGADQTFATPARPPAAVDLALSQAAVRRGTTVTYTLKAADRSATAATGVTLTDPLPGRALHVSGHACSGRTTVVCRLGTLAPGAHATVTIRVRAARAGTLTNTALVTGDQPDPARGDDLATTRIAPPRRQGSSARARSATSSRARVSCAAATAASIASTTASGSCPARVGSSSSRP